MSVLLVKNLGLNLRNTPKKVDYNVINILYLGHEVTVIRTVPETNYSEIETTVNGENVSGFVASKYLRPAVSPEKEALLKEVTAQWLRFHQGVGKEWQDPYFRFIGEMWQLLELNLHGRSLGEDGNRVPWSAAFISFVVRRAGYDRFLFAQAHADYIRDAIQKRELNQESTYWGFRLNEHRPQIGDLICGWRMNRPVTYDAIPGAFFPSHCDLVVDVWPKKIVTIGGNVKNSVNHKEYWLDENGFLDDTRDGQRSLFAILRNNL